MKKRMCKLEILVAYSLELCRVHAVDFEWPRASMSGRDTGESHGGADLRLTVEC